MKASRRCALLMVVGLAIESRPALAQRWACYPIHSGDTAASLAVRIAGNAEHRHRSWFQILDPATSTFVAKARYDDIHPGWLACVSRRLVGPPPLVTRRASTVRLPAASPDVAQPLAGIYLHPVWFVVLLLPAACVAAYGAARLRKGRRIVMKEMTRFGVIFIREFERPLIQPRDFRSAIRSRLRCKPRRGRLEVLLAPADGRSYPNLADHKHNVEYDTERVLQVLRDRRFVSDSLRQQGEWVVVPFQINVREKQEGVR